MDLWTALAAERRALADLLDSLSPEQWQVQTLCPAWDVHGMAAHLLVPCEFSTGEMLATMVRARGNPDRLSVLMAARRAEKSSAELVAAIRQNADSRKAPPIVGVLGPYTDSLVHGEDLRVPLGLADDRQAERWRPSLDFLVSAKAKLGFRSEPLLEVALRAGDIDWHHGSGPVVEGPAAAIGLALARRRTWRLRQLHGEGASVLRSWVGEEGPAACPPAAAFAAAYAHWGLHLPDHVVRTGADGYLTGNGWMVRWRWHDDGGLETVASHRMTDERWTTYEPDGSPTGVEAGPEFYVDGPQVDDASDAAARTRRWYGAQARAKTAAGMDHDVRVAGPSMPPIGQDEMLWRTDDGPWNVVELAPRD